MAKTVNAKTYAKNVLKSAKYISTETIKGINPDLTSFVTEGVKSAKNMYKGVKSLKHKGGVTNLIDKLIGSENRQEAAQLVKNVREDLRTGNFYNPAREDSNMDKAMKAMGVDFDFDFDDINFDVNDEDVNSTSSGDAATSAIVTMSDRIANTQRVSTSVASNKLYRGARYNTRASMLHNERLFGQVNSSLSVINSSIMNLHKDITTPLNTHIINSTNFYTTATTELAKQTSYLENMNKIITDRFSPISKNGFNNGSLNSFSKSAWNTVMGNSGIPNIGEWFKSAKNNIFDKTGLDSFLDPEFIQMALLAGGGSPISTIATMILGEKIQNGSIGKGFNRTANILRNGVMNAGFKIHDINIKRNGKGLLGKLASIFDIVPDMKRKDKMDFSKFNRGRADWTGQDSKALQEVIPTQLAAILSAISGQEAKIFDYRSGKFVTASNIIKQFNLDRRENISQKTNEFKNEVIDDFIKNDKSSVIGKDVAPMTYGSRGVTKLGKDFDIIMSLFSMRTDIDVTTIRNSTEFINICVRNKWDKFVNKKSIEIIARSIFKNKSRRSPSFVNSVLSARMSDKDFSTNINSNLGAFGNVVNGSNIINAHKHGMFNSITDTVDDKGHNVFFYLQDYYKQLRMIVNRVSGNGSYTKKSKKYGYHNQSLEIPVAERKFDLASASRSKISSFKILRQEDEYNEDEDRDVWGIDKDTGKHTWIKSSTRASREAEKKEKESLIVKVINKGNDILENILYGDTSKAIVAEYHKKGGLFGLLKSLPENIADAAYKAKEKIKDFFKDKWNKFKKSNFGQAFFKSGKDTLKDFGSSTFEYANEKVNKLSKWIKGNDYEAEVKGSYNGGHVKKSGMVSVSEGEIIIPAKYNPYYTGKMTDNARKFIERKNYNKWISDGGDEDDFFGFYANGGKTKSKKNNHNPYKMKPLTNSDKDKIIRLYNEGYTIEKISRKVKRPIHQVKNYVNNITLKQKGESVKNGFKNAFYKFKNSDVGEKVEKIVTDTAHHIENSLNNVFGKEKIDNIKSNIKEILRSAKVNLPKTVSNGMIGAITAGAITGSGVGILGGFAIGAGVNIIKNSDSISKKLFGEFDQSANNGKGEWVGGKLPSNVTKFIKGKLPKTMKAGAVGGILGSLGMAPGGLYGGLVLGAGLELVSGTETFQKLLLGSKGVDDKRRGGLIGSIKVRVIDPLANYVKEGTKKISEFVKKYVFEPVKNMFSPLKDWGRGLKTRIGNFFKEGTKKVKRSLMEKIDSMMLRPAISTVGAIGKGIIKGTGWALKKPGQLLNATARGLTRHNIKMGYSSKSAAERVRLEAEKKHGDVHYSPGLAQYNQWASNASDEDIIKANHYLNGKQSFNTGIINARQGIRDSIVGSLTNGGVASPKVIKTITKLMNSDDVVKNNDFSNVVSYINNIDPSLMDDSIKDAVKEKIEEKKQEIDKMKSDMGEGFEDRQKEFLSKIGYTESQIRNIAKGTGAYSKRIRRQAALDYARSTENLDKKSMQDIDNAIKTVDAAKRLKEQDQENPQGAKTNSILQDIAATTTCIGNKIGVTDKDVAKKIDHNNSESSSNTTISSNITTSSSTTTSNNTSSNNTNSNKNGDTRQITDSDGNLISQIYQDGKWTNNESNPDTKNVIDQRAEDRRKRNKFYDFFTNGNFLNNIKDIFAGKKDEDGERSGGIFGFLKNIFGRGFRLFGGFKGILSTLGIGALTYFLGKNKFGTSLDSGMRKGMDPELRKQEIENSGFITKMKLGADSIENSIRGRDTTTYNEDDYVTPYMSDRMLNGIGKNMVLSLNPVYAKSANKVIKNTIGHVPLIGKGISGLMRAPNKLAGKITPKLAKMGVDKASKLLKNATLEDLVTNPSILRSIQKNNLKNGRSIDFVSDVVRNRFGPQFIKNNSAIAKAGDAFSFSAKKSATLASKLPGTADDVAKAASKKGFFNPKNVFAKIADPSLAKTKAGKVASKTVNGITKCLKKIVSFISKKFGISGADEVIEKACNEGAEQIAKKGGTKLAKNLAKASTIIRAVFVAHAFLSGIQSSKAKTILGILESPTFFQRLLAGSLNALNELIPGIGGIIPTEFLFTVVYTILEVLGMDFTNLTELRAQAKATVDQYNAENNTTYNIEEYINNVLGETTIGQKIWGGIKSGAKKAWKGLKEFFGYDDESGSGTVKNVIGESTFSRNNSKLNNLSLPMYKDYSLESKDSSYPKPTTNTTDPDKSSASGSFNKPKPFKNINAKKYTGSASGIHTMQKGNFTKFGKTTIDKNGCGPAAACTVLKAYGKNIGINDAANYAESGGYVAGSSGIGTKASYFGDILNKNGINTNYVDTGYDINHAVSSGKPTVLLGQDNSNKSKSRSPFGPNPHYIVTRGMDNRGNVIVDDPELGGTALYKKNILRNAKLGIATGGNSDNTDDTSESNGDNTTTEEKSDSPIQKIVNIFRGKSGIFNSIGNYLGNTTYGKIFRYIFNGPSGKAAYTDTSSSIFNALNSWQGSVQPFEPQINGLPDPESPYAQYYINDKLDGGLNISSRGEFYEDGPCDPTYTALPNCTAYASGRFEHISQQIEGPKPGIGIWPGISKATEDKNLGFEQRINKYLRYPGLRDYAENFITVAKRLGLQTSGADGEPQVGAIMVWRKGKVGNKNDGMGHVAIVETVSDDKNTVVTSESGWRYKTFYSYNRGRNEGGTNRWGIIGGKNSSEYVFIGFIYNPSVTKAGNIVHFTPKNNKEFIYQFLKLSNKFNDSAIAGIMANWANEGGRDFDPTSLEGWYSGGIIDSSYKYPGGKDAAFRTYDTLSEYTTNYLHRWYDSINDNAKWKVINSNKAHYDAHPEDILKIKKEFPYDPNRYYDEESGRYYPGIGLAGWTGENTRKLIEWSNSRGKDYRTLDGQLDFFMNGNYRESQREKLFNNMNVNTDGSIKSPEDAAEYFAYNYENGNMKKSEVNERRRDATELYNEISKYGSGSGLPKVVDPTASGSKIAIDYDFTKLQNKSHNNTGSASSINIPASIMNIHDSSDKKIDAIITFLKQIVTNTTYNAAIPNLVDIIKQSISIMTGLNSSNTSVNMSTKINNEIQLMQSKLEAIAKSI